MAVATIERPGTEIAKGEPIPGLIRLDEIQREVIKSNRIRRADEIIATLLPLDLHSAGSGNKYETKAYAETHRISLLEARRDLVLMPTSARIARSHR